MLRYACALLLVAAATISSAGLASSGTPFDGRWSVVVETDKGACDRAYRYGLQITNGKVIGWDHAVDDATHQRVAEII